jgi:HEAT repeat protein
VFWLAEKAGTKIAGAISDAIENDPDTEVKKRAVFALTQMPEGEGIPLLIRVAKTDNNPDVRKQCSGWANPMIHALSISSNPCSDARKMEETRWTQENLVPIRSGEV